MRHRTEKLTTIGTYCFVAREEYIRSKIEGYTVLAASIHGKPFRVMKLISIVLTFIGAFGLPDNLSEAHHVLMTIIAFVNQSRVRTTLEGLIKTMREVAKG